MTKVVITFDVDNAAYRREDGSIDFEAVRETIRAVADGAHLQTMSIMDANGNRVGKYEVKDGV